MLIRMAVIITSDHGSQIKDREACRHRERDNNGESFGFDFRTFFFCSALHSHCSRCVTMNVHTPFSQHFFLVQPDAFCMPQTRITKFKCKLDLHISPICASKPSIMLSAHWMTKSERASVHTSSTSSWWWVTSVLFSDCIQNHLEKICWIFEILIWLLHSVHRLERFSMRDKGFFFLLNYFIVGFSLRKAGRV